MGSRTWVFTWNNFEGQLDFTPYDHVRYAVWQHERGEEGTHHYQGYIELSKPQRLAAMKKILPQAHFEPRKGTREQARAYAMKEDSRVEGPWEYGEWTGGGQGRRNDLKALVQKVKEGKTNRELIDEHPESYAKFFKAVDRIRHDLAPHRNFKTEVYFIWGDTGLGKTKWCNQQSPDAYMKQRGEWWDGYDGTSDVIIDDFYGWLPYDTLLRLTDRYQCRVEIKGGHVNFAPKKLYVTSNHWPHGWYKDVYFNALARRVDHFMYFVGPDKFIEATTYEQINDQL